MHHNNGDLVIIRFKNETIALIVANVYAPNDHNSNYFNHLKDLMLDTMNDYRTYSVIIMGDFNITLEGRDSIIRNTSKEELNARIRHQSVKCIKLTYYCQKLYYNGDSIAIVIFTKING